MNKRFWRKIVSDNRHKLFCQLIVMLLSATVNIMTAYIYMKIIDNITALNIKLVLLSCILYLSSLTISFAIEILIEYCNKSISNQIDIDLKKKVFDTLLARSGENISKTDSSEYTSLLLADTSKVAEVVTALVLPSILAGFRVMGMVAFLLYVNWKLLIIVIIMQPFLWPLQSKLKGQINRFSKENRDRTVDFLGAIKEYTGNLFEIILLGNNNYFSKRLTDKAVIHKETEKKLMLIESVNKGIIGLLTVLPTVVLLVVGALEVAKDQMTVGALLVYVQYYGSLFSPLGDIFSNIFSYEQYKPSILRVFECLKESVEEDKYERIDGEVSFLDVSFAYEKNENILKHINLCFKQGMVYGVYGKSGCGKSTLCKLLLGFWAPTEGKILIGEKDVQTISKVALRKHICYISQDNYMFNDTVYNNIVLGKKCSKERFEEVLQLSNLKELIDTLPEREQAQIGDKGSLLSGGQKKRIALARAYVAQAQVIILDEPTNGLDKENAIDIMKKLLQENKKAIIIIISHQTEVIELCDKVYYVENGRIKNEKSKNSNC